MWFHICVLDHKVGQVVVLYHHAVCWHVSPHIIDSDSLATTVVQVQQHVKEQPRRWVAPQKFFLSYGVVEEICTHCLRLIPLRHVSRYHSIQSGSKTIKCKVEPMEYL